MPFDVEAVTRLLEAGGPLEEHLKPYEPRASQTTMAREVSLVFQHGGRLVVEAPTGVGKSLAYLLPSILWARSSGRPVVVATFTRALQDQLLRHDSPIASEVVGGGSTIVALKGRGNYLCRRRLLKAMSVAPPTQARLWETVADWAAETETGDLSELDGLDPDEMAFVTSRVASDSEACSGNRCSAAEGCFWKRARALAAQADVLILNHALLTIELLGERGMLPNHGALIVDEAHHLEDAATRQMTLTIGARRMKALGERSQSESDGVAGLVKRVLSTWGETEAAEIRPLLKAWQKSAGMAAARGEVWFSRLNSGDEYVAAESRRRYRDPGELKRICPTDPGEFIDQVEEGRGDGRRLLSAFGEAAAVSPDPVFAEEAVVELESVLKEWDAVSLGLEIVLHPEGIGGDWVHWKEWSDRETFNLVAAPADISGPLGASLRERYDRVVLTSATLAVGEAFDHVLRRLGLPGSTATLALDSPFDFPAAVKLLSVLDAPDPRDVGYAAYLARAIEELVLATRRKTLVLFTSYALLRDVAALVKAPLENSGVKVSAQGRDGSASTLLRKFRRPGPALLLGTASFWEGIDLPGEALEVLVVTRLPFPVPSDPLVESRCDNLKEMGYDPFLTFSVPEAVLKLRQGFGRLIRRQGDRGIVAVLDGRFLNARYGRVFQGALPCPVDRCADLFEVAEKAQAWMADAAEVAG
jgi:ATP-dependent DNA helicase DinG